MTRSPHTPPRGAAALAAAILSLLLAAAPALAQATTPAAADEPPPQAESHSLIDFVLAGGIIGHMIIALSVVSVAVVIDTALRMRRDKLLPENLVRTSLELAEAGRLNEVLSMNKASDSMFGRIVGGALDRARHGVDAVRQEMQQLGEAEVLRLRNRVGYIGVFATAAPMLGLLGTVIGMISSFSVLGQSKNAARPDELAVGISVALVTTCEGLLLAVPLIFVHAWLRDRVTAVSQETAHAGERLLGLLANVAARQRITTSPPQGPAPMPATRPGMNPPAYGATGYAATAPAGVNAVGVAPAVAPAGNAAPASFPNLGAPTRS